MRAWSIAVVAVAACGFQPDESTDAHVDSRTVVDSPPIDAVVDSANPDRDGDGIPNGSDNCPDAFNPDQHDFDHDGHGDVCDHCPHLPSGSDPDTDHDGVGDACDPRPGSADHIVLFEGFYEGGSGSSWTSRGGDWVVVPDQGITQDTAQGGEFYVDIPIGSAMAPVVTTQVRPGGLGSGFQAVGVAVTTSSSVYNCAVFEMGGSDAMASASVSGSNDAVEWPGAFVAEQIRITQAFDTASRCQMADPAVLPAGSDIAVQVPQIDAQPVAHVSLATDDATANFAYVFVVDESP